tara:strand:- start:1780 stop:2850 length:1071 start_codon:yes stop_codon:yes gene_type:complete
MSDSTDTDYIEDKNNEKNGSTDKDNSPNYIKWVIDVIKYFIYALIVFIVGAGAIVNASDPRYQTVDEDGEKIFGNWPGTDVEGPPYCCPGEKQPSSGKKSAKSVIKEFFDLSKYNKPYNVAEVRRLISNELEINSWHEKHADDGAELPDHLLPELDSRAMMWPWAIRMTGYSYSYMRSFLQAGVLNLFPKFNGEANNNTSLAFTLGGILLFGIFILLHFIPLLFTIIGAVSTFSSFAWIGWPGFTLLCMPLLIPAILYVFLGIIGTPLITGMINNFIQPYFYLGFMLEPLFKNFEAVKKVMIAHSHIIGITGVIITVALAFADASNAPSFGIGVLIAACFVLAMAGHKHVKARQTE